VNRGSSAALASLTRVRWQARIHNDDDLHVKGPATPPPTITCPPRGRGGA